ncbi:hypothetical protein NDU88_010369 [Pleurodeles waltl]|uniref:Uncharacterized protein n=1 Tax=Pleurodeles waltl TaxID=8319 RepID=A0AAV7S0G8_PLEWA|nr:hypothetical protein NDU88_010369 [Pleurodeles waltl]
MDRFPSTQSTQLLEQEVKENRCQEGRDTKTTTVTKTFCLQECRPGTDSPINQFHWMNPRDQPEGRRKTEVKRRENIEREKAKEQSQREGGKEQRESRYIEKKEKQRRGVTVMGYEATWASNQMLHNPTEEANQEDTDPRAEDETWTEEWCCPLPPDYALTPPQPRESCSPHGE